MGNTQPQPQDSLPHPCYKCSKPTLVCFSEYPKSNDVKYRCPECKESKQREQKVLMDAFIRQCKQRKAEGKDSRTGL